jgi:hypothetical protein
LVLVVREATVRKEQVVPTLYFLQSLQLAVVLEDLEATFPPLLVFLAVQVVAVVLQIHLEPQTVAQELLIKVLLVVKVKVTLTLLIEQQVVAVVLVLLGLTIMVQVVVEQVVMALLFLSQEHLLITLVAVAAVVNLLVAQAV